MMFPMVGLVSAKVWAGLPEEDRAMISELMSKHLSAVAASYVDKEPVWIDQIKGAGKTFVKVDRSFFGDMAETWSAKWSEKSTALDDLCAIAAATAE